MALFEQINRAETKISTDNNSNEPAIHAIADQENLEIELDELYDLLGAELGQLWMNKISKDEIDTENAIVLIKNVLEERKAVLSKLGNSFNNEPISNFENIASNGANTFDLIARIYENRNEHMVGTGSVADVVFDERYGGTCLKIVRSFDEYQKHNTLYEEARILNSVQHFRYEEARAPRFYFADQSEKGNLHVMGMEFIDGYSLRDVAEGRAVLPKDFDIEKFREQAEGFVNELHKNHVFHGDLHAGNIMICSDGDYPIIIDFGLSKTHLYFSELEEASKRDFQRLAGAFLELENGI